jgi:hypothetical protein
MWTAGPDEDFEVYDRFTTSDWCPAAQHQKEHAQAEPGDEFPTTSVSKKHDSGLSPEGSCHRLRGVLHAAFERGILRIVGFRDVHAKGL